MSDGATTTCDFVPITVEAQWGGQLEGPVALLAHSGRRAASSRDSSTTGLQATPIVGGSMAVGEAAGPVLTKPFATHKIRHRVFELMKCCAEDGEPMPSVESHDGLMGFIGQIGDVRMPLLTSDDDGLLVATWRQGQHAMLSIRFLNASKIEFAIATETRLGKIARDWGEMDWKSFLDRTPLARTFAAGES